MSKSLVQRLDTSGDSRYRLLEIIRDFAAARLADDDELDSGRDRHLAWALDLIGDLEAAMRTERQDRALAVVVAEHDNLRSARLHAMECGDEVAALRITASAPIDPNSERGPLLARLLDHASEAPLSVQARARYTCVSVAFESGDYAAGASHGRLASAMFRALGDPLQEAYAILMDAFCRWGLGEGDVGQEFAQAAAIFDDLEDTMGRAYVSWTMAQWLLEHRPDAVEIEALAKRGVELFAAIDAEFGLAHAREGLAYVRLRSGNGAQALSLIADAMLVFNKMGNLGCLAHTVDATAFCVAAMGDLKEAARLVGAAELMRELSGSVRRPWEMESYGRLFRRLSAELPAEELQRMRAEGRNLSSDQTVTRIRGLVGMS